MRLISIGNARRVHLFDIQTVEGNLLYWADVALTNVPAAITADGNPATVSYQPWILTAPRFSFHRSMQTDTGSFTVQNVSGDTLARDFERIVRRSAMEGALFVIATGIQRPRSPIARYMARSQQHRHIDGRAGLRAAIQRPGRHARRDLHRQLAWREKRCGATGTTECLNTYATCQVPEHYKGLMVTFEKNFGEALPDLPT